MIGTTIGSYEIRAALGAGGMGEVYRAHDSKLGRDVALKLLPAAFAGDPDRVARLRREAQVLASLSHANIAAIHGLEESGGVPVLVLELVEGPTLADRIAAGRLPLDDSYAIARQVADGLEAAHERGIVHRDLKPANIKLRPDGGVKVLDFGLAKALESSQHTTGPSPVTNLTMTRDGAILGTTPYMSPEQSRGLAVDRKTDIWAWACVLFEMLSGRQAFAGSDTTDVTAAILRGEPDWSLLPAATAPGVRRLLRRCLEKDPRKRLADIRDARLALDDAVEDSRAAASPARARAGRERVAWIAALVVCLLGAVALWWHGNTNGDRATHEVRAEITTPPTTDPVSFALSPNGERIAFVASLNRRPLLWVRSLSTGESAPLQGTEGAAYPFWSPDSRSIGFFANDRLYRIGMDGGSLKELGAAPVGTGGAWNRDGTIVYTMVPDANVGRVSENGGAFQFLPTDQKAPAGNRFPRFLPDGRHYLYFVAEAGIRGVYVGELDRAERRHLLDADATAVFVPPADLLFVRAGTLYVQHFDAAALALKGDPAPVARGVVVDDFGALAGSAADDGSIVFRAGASRQRQLAWFDRSGAQIGEAFPPDPATVLNPKLSPDGRQVALTRSISGNVDVWLQDLTRKNAYTRLTTAPTPDIYPIWSPDGMTLAYGGWGEGKNFAVKLISAAGGESTVAFDGPAADVPMDWSRDGRFILYRAQSQTTTRMHLWALPMSPVDKPFAVTPLTEAADERTGQFSPDGKWVAFESNESGRYEIYVQAFPKPGARTVVSTDGGLQPRWGPDSQELYYVTPDARLMGVALRVRDEATIEAASPALLFQTRINGALTGGSVMEYDVSRDGRFFMNTVVEQAAEPITLIVNRPR
jgi:Tol biopolymer transport system component